VPSSTLISAPLLEGPEGTQVLAVLRPVSGFLHADEIVEAREGRGGLTEAVLHPVAPDFVEVNSPDEGMEVRLENVLSMSRVARA
jgi:hypothetical protein